MSNPYTYDLPVTEMVERYREVYSGAVYDVLDQMGYPNQALAQELKPVVAGMKIAGPAFTMKGIPDITGNEALRERRIHMFRDMAATGVPLIDVRDCSSDDQVAHYGEMNAVVGAACGVIGAVVDGGSRDTQFIIDSDFPVFCRFQSPVEAYMRWSYYTWQEPVALRGALTNTVIVHPGDFLVGDLDGVVVIPRDMVVDALYKVEELIAHENVVRKEFMDGADPVAVYERHQRL